MKVVARWLLAGLVTIAAFAAATWISGAVILPVLIRDSATRWGLASGFGVAVAAFAALWGHSFASEHPAEQSSAGSVGADIPGPAGTHNKISGGTFYGPVFQARDVFGQVSDGMSPQDTEHPTQG